MPRFPHRRLIVAAKYPGLARCLQAALRAGSRSMMAAALVTLAGLITAPPFALRTAAAAESWKEELTALISRHPGEVAVAIKDLRDGESFAHRANEPMPTASLIKFPVMAEAYRQSVAGQLSLATPVELRDEDKVPGSGILTTHFSSGATFSLRDAVRMMIAWSDNTATNLVIDRIGLASTSRFMNELGCPETQLHSKVFRRDTSIAPERSRQFGIGSTTANDMIRLLERLHRRELVDAASSEAMLEHLRACQDATTLPSGVPATVRVAHKTGAVTGVRTDAGLLELPGRAIAVCVLTRNNRRQADSNADPGEQLCERITRVVYTRFRPSDAEQARLAGESRQSFAMGDSGEHVRSLQMRLNAALRPATKTPDTSWEPLDEDGEFGPATRAAVERWQRREGFAPTGRISPTEWQRLGKQFTTMNER